MPDVPALSGRIFVADDETGICKGVRRVLETTGVTVEMAHDGPSAWDRLETGAFDVALIDLLMPGFGGMEIISRAAGGDLRTVLIVITAHATIETAVEAVRLGAFDYLPKPFVPADLILRVERALQWRRLHDEAQRLLLELQSDQTQLNAIVNSLADGVLIVNRDGQVVLSNPAARALFGCHEIAGPTCLEDVVRGHELAALISGIAAAPPGQRAALSTRFPAGDSTYMARVVPLETETGDFLGSATVLRDVTELVTLERAKAQFMSMVAHELKSPLAAVQGYLRVILADPSLDTAKVLELVGRCSERLEGATELVRDLLELSRADAMPVRRIESLVVGEIVADVLEANVTLADKHQVGVRAEVAPTCPPVPADRDDLFRLLTNLVSNGIKYNRPGGEVVVRAEAQGEGVLLEVRDTGLGIPEEARARLGEEFFRVNAPDRKGIVGTGLGLALVQRVVDTYHGRLELTSQVGEGSTFRVWLPCAAPPPA